MAAVLYLGLETALVGLAIWIGVGIVDQGNPENTPGLALLFAAMFVVTSAYLSWVAFLPLVIFFWALIRHYDLAIWKCFVVLALMVAAELAFELLGGF